METLLLVIAVAISWHLGLAFFERQRCPKQDRPSLAKLLLLAEVEALRTLRAELRRRNSRGHDDRCERKLLEVDERLKEVGEDGTGADH